MKVKIVSRKGRPVARLEMDVDTFYVHPGYDSKVRPGDTPDSCFISIDYIWRFLKLNQQHFHLESLLNITIDKDSIKYYGFDKGNGEYVYRTSLTDSFIRDFLNYDAESIVRFEPNVDGSVNGLGMSQPEFECKILINGFNEIRVDSDTTEDECKAILRNCASDSVIAKAIYAHLNYMHKHVQIEEMRNTVQDYEAKLNQIFAKYEPTLRQYNETLVDSAFDCGFTNVYTTNHHVKDALQTLISSGERHASFLDVKFPDDYFNCSHSHNILDKLRTLCDDSILNEIYVQTILD